MMLDKIVEHKKKEIAVSKLKKPLSFLMKEAARAKRSRGFLRSLQKAGSIHVIAEIKRRSPSKGVLRKIFKPVALARTFEKAGASALSVLTDKKFFGGSPDILKKVHRTTTLPILRKDFILEEYQVYETKQMGADALLLIAAILSKNELASLSSLARRLDLDVLFEVHTPSDIQKILPLKPRLVGINNRDLKTFRVNLETTKRLSRKIPRKCLLVSESGIKTSEDMALLKKWGVRAVLVGESLMKEKNAGCALERLLGKLDDSR
jgi:indole-3-glycerol phosphate synthase